MNKNFGVKRIIVVNFLLKHRNSIKSFFILFGNEYLPFFFLLGLLRLKLWEIQSICFPALILPHLSS
jgi:hypothetical protein